MSRLDIIIGPMFAGKSTELLRRINQLKVLDIPYLVVKPDIDTRYNQNKVVSHDNNSHNCQPLKCLSDLYTLNHFNNINTLFIDEAQFFNNLQKNVLHIVEELNKNVVIVGLDGDFQRNKFGQILDLIPYADSCQKITSLCKKCGDGTPALFSHRIQKSSEQVSLGAGDEYESLCRKHYLQSTKL